ncbi:MAG: hypothetical protein WAQ52_10625 [Terriglobales bacterium]
MREGCSQGWSPPLVRGAGKYVHQSRITAALSLVSLGISACLACKHASPAPNNPIEEETATINLSVVTNSNQTQTFKEVKRASLLPKAVLDQFGGMADPGQPFNTTDLVDPGLPMRQLIVAAVSKQYCIVSYWQGGISLSFKTTIFELSGENARIIWVSDSQGGLNFRDLKEMVESGRMHNDLPRASR